MAYQIIDGIPVYNYNGEQSDKSLEQAKEVAEYAAHTVLMGDHHPGYHMPIGGVAAFYDVVSPAAVGYDIGCGNDAARLDINPNVVTTHIQEIMDTIYNTLSFGIGLKNETKDARLVNLWLSMVKHPAWDIPVVEDLLMLAYEQLGTIGAGNHFSNLHLDEQNNVWVGVHFGSRGFGHKIASYYMKQAKEHGVGEHYLYVDSDLGQEYLAAMDLAGKYAQAGRQWVVAKVAEILGAESTKYVANFHNFAWREVHFGQEVIVIRKGATPLFPGQLGYVGGSMGDDAVIIEAGNDIAQQEVSLFSTVHGAGRVMSRTEAKGRYKKGRLVTPGKVNWEMVHDWLNKKGVTLRGGGLDESPHVYKRLDQVLQHHQGTTKVVHTLRPIGVAMAGKEDGFDLYKD